MTLFLSFSVLAGVRLIDIFFRSFNIGVLSPTTK